MVSPVEFISRKGNFESAGELVVTRNWCRPTFAAQLTHASFFIILSFLRSSQTRRISFKIINSPTLLLPRWRAVTASTPFENRTLPRDVATRWNSTYDMLKVFLELKEYVIKFTDSSSNGLADYMLSDDEWEAVEGLVSALKVCIRLLLQVPSTKIPSDSQGCYRILLV